MTQPNHSGLQGWPWLAVGIVACTALAALLRLTLLGGQSLWVDEELTVRTVAQPWAGFWHSCIGDNNSPPLYFLLVKAVTAVAGDSDAALRLVSAISGTLSVALLSCLVLALGRSPSAALAAGFLLALNPLHVWFSQEARPYALMVCFGLLALLGAARAVRAGSVRAWGVLLLGSLLSFLSHATGIAFVAAAWLWFAIERPPRSAWKGLAAGSALFAAVAIPVTAYIASVQVSVPPPRAITGLELPYALYALVAGFSLGPSLRELQVGGAAALQGSGPALAAGAAAWAGMAWAGVAGRRGLALWFSLTIMPLGVALALAVQGDFPFNIRYAIGAVVGVAGLAACTGDQVGPRLRAGLHILLAGIFATATVQWFTNPRYAKDDARSAVAWLSAHAAPDAVIAVAPLYAEAVVEHYARRQAPAADIRPAESAADLAAMPRLDALVITRRQHVPRVEELMAFVREAGGPVERAEFPGFEVLLLRPRGPGPI
jgi:4-amino-4-deoxy-L-arabinose transferase-like glycosyltransferase